MGKFKRFYVPMLLCAVLVAGASAYYTFFNQKRKKPDHFIQDKAGLLRLLKNSSEIHRLWNEGEESREWKEMKLACQSHFNFGNDFDESLLRCHPILIECLALFGKNLDYKINKNEEFNKYYRYISKSNTAHVGLSESGILVEIEDLITQKKLDLFLKDNCHEIYLEQRVYAYGEPPESKDAPDYRFDNFDRHIYIDKHLVTNSEINDWIDFGNEDFTKGIMKKSGGDFFMPAVDLNEAQMENFCSFKGKQLLLAHFFDAATFLPMDLKDINPKKNDRSPYYWTKKKSEFKEDCNLFYAKECTSKKSFRLNSAGPTWSGLMDPMGGVLEAFRNPIDPDSNLKASSFYFDFKSSWHKLGFRAKWDGEGRDVRNFDFRGFNPFLAIDKYQVGFRCMREEKP